MTGEAPASKLAWDPTDEDRRAEVHHVDAARRPWRAAAMAVGTLAVGALVVPRPVGAAAVVLLLLGSALAAVAAWRLPVIRSERGLAGPSAVTLALDPEAVTLVRDGIQQRLSPASVARLAVGEDHVFLHLVGGEVLTVPTRVFGPRGALDRFVLAVERFRKAGAPPPDRREAGFDTWSLRYRLDARRLAPGEARTSEIEVRALGGVALAGLAVVVVANDPWGNGLDLALVALFAAIVVLVLALSGRRAQVAVGPVHAGFGPLGGRVHGPGGLLRFEWKEVREVVEDSEGVAVAFRDRVLPVPGTAFRSPEDQARFVGAIEDWWLAAQSPPKAVAPSTPEALAEANANPFTPPR